jgi:hypothetical protein
MGISPSQRALYGRIGAAIARSRHDPRDLTSAGRASFLARFERQVREQFPDLPDAEIQRRAGEARRAHMLRLSARSVETRGNKKGAVSPQRADAPEVRRASDATTAERS